MGNEGNPPPEMVCDGDVCYFPDDAETDGPPPLLGESLESSNAASKRSLPLPGLLAGVTELIDSDGKPVPMDALLALPDKVVG